MDPAIWLPMAITFCHNRPGCFGKCVAKEITKSWQGCTCRKTGYYWHLGLSAAIFRRWISYAFAVL